MLSVDHVDQSVINQRNINQSLNFKQTQTTMAAIMTPENAQEQALFTCLSCSIAFLSAEEQSKSGIHNWREHNLQRRMQDSTTGRTTIDII